MTELEKFTVPPSVSSPAVLKANQSHLTNVRALGRRARPPKFTYLLAVDGGESGCGRAYQGTRDTGSEHRVLALKK